MTKSEWIERASQNSDMTKKELKQAFDALFDEFKNAVLNGEAVQISGLGTFEVREQEAHAARNPKTNQQVLVPKTRRLVFLPGKTIKEKINET